MIMVQSSSVVVGLTYVLILSSVVMDMVHRLHLRNRLVGKILQNS